ncbi:hypothetical protein [Streptomyces sp. TRM68367]|uniref:hypothetical protein n=1 Tax=Streptomyces sp. TRM68367 TaxID=2758415 RepID=UPI00165CE0F1|nr:hypothetical protein [Streptomyces sp. TRM68367]MBC9730688.1 hypothetical protein [Streptomyces sp. TRM68367]
MSERVNVSVLLLIGDVAEVTTPERDSSDPERVPVERITKDTGLARGELAGADLVAVVGENGELERFELP